MFQILINHLADIISCQLGIYVADTTIKPCLNCKPDRFDNVKSVAYLKKMTNKNVREDCPIGTSWANVFCCQEVDRLY